MNRPTPIVDLVPFHLSNQGTNGCPIFLDDADYEHFLTTLGIAISRHAVRLYAWTLLPTEFHLIAEQERRGNLPGAIHLVETASARMFNLRHQRFGRLFSGPYQNTRLFNSEEVAATTAKMFQMPLERGLGDASDHWPWSSNISSSGRIANAHSSIARVLANRCQ
jgi:putative transposase